MILLTVYKYADTVTEFATPILTWATSDIWKFEWLWFDSQHLVSATLWEVCGCVNPQGKLEHIADQNITGH